MKLHEYVNDAIRTESKIDELKVNGQLLINTLTLFISAGQMLDQIKKNTFYNKPYTEEFSASFMTARDSIAGLNGVSLTEAEDIYDVDTRVFHSIIGIATESTELCEALFDTMLSDRDFDSINLLEELGDVNWYQAIMVDALGGDWENILENNIAKLKKRFADKYNDEDAQNRDLDSEREILETMTTK